MECLLIYQGKGFCVFNVIVVRWAEDLALISELNVIFPAMRKPRSKFRSSKIGFSLQLKRLTTRRKWTIFGTNYVRRV